MEVMSNNKKSVPFSEMAKIPKTILNNVHPSK
jgi:hypothetical protein